MVMDQMTPKTHVARHYFKFIQPGAVRVDATPVTVRSKPVPMSTPVRAS
jgi:hypothetical protein